MLVVENCISTILQVSCSSYQFVRIGKIIHFMVLLHKIEVWDIYHQNIKTKFQFNIIRLIIVDFYMIINLKKYSMIIIIKHFKYRCNN